MTVKTISWVAALLIASASAGCGNHANPTAPTAAYNLDAAPTSAVTLYQVDERVEHLGCQRYRMSLVEQAPLAGGVWRRLGTHSKDFSLPA